MQLGLLTVPFANQSLEEVATWSAASGFETLEIACWPKANGTARRYAGTCHIDVVNLSESEALDIAAMMRGKGLDISALGFYPNALHPEVATREAIHAHIRATILAARRMGVKVVNTFVGGDLRAHVDDNWAEALRVWPELVRFAVDNGVKIAFENCPMIFSKDEWPGGTNIAYSPVIWRRIFDQWDESVGMNFDPSHLIWQMIDPNRFVAEFGKKIVHVHAKDLQIDRDGLYDHGILSAGIGWQIPRMPGLGEVDWPAFFASLYRVGYDGPIVIEHEDRAFEGSVERLRRGFCLARDVLRPFIK